MAGSVPGDERAGHGSMSDLLVGIQPGSAVSIVPEQNLMGVNDRKNEQREQKRDEKRRRQLAPQQPVSMDQVDLEALAYCLQCIINGGGALRVGATRDKGCWAFGVYGDGPAPYTEYVRQDEDLTLYLTNLAHFFEEPPPKP